MANGFLIVIGVIVFLITLVISRHISHLTQLANKNHGLLYDVFQAYWQNLQTVLENIAKEVDPALRVDSTYANNRWAWTIFQGDQAKAVFEAEFGTATIFWKIIVNDQTLIIDILPFGQLEQTRGEIKERLTAHIHPSTE